ncbi:hypothetical protein ABK040_015097 [Willaertia magna]
MSPNKQQFLPEDLLIAHVFPSIIDINDINPNHFVDQILNLALVCKQWFKITFNILNSNINNINSNIDNINKFNKLISKENEIKIIPSFINFTGETIEVPLEIPGMIGCNFVQWAYVYPFQYQSFCPSLMSNYIKKEILDKKKNELLINKFIKPLINNFNFNDNNPHYKKTEINNNYYLEMNDLTESSMITKFIDEYKNVLEHYATILDHVTYKKIEKEVYIPKYMQEWSKNLMCCCFNKELLNLNDNINEKKEEKEYKKELMNWWDENIFFYFRGNLFDEDFNLFSYVHYIFGKNGKGYLYMYGCSD